MVAETTQAQVPEKAPPFTLADPDVKDVALEDLLGEGPVVLMFVPHPIRGVCRKTACGLRDAYAELEAAGARVVGISPMSPRTHKRVQEDQRLPFVHLSDRGNKVAEEYGVRAVIGFVPGRATFVLDKEGHIRWAERNPLLAHKHVEGALQAVKRLVE